MTGAVITRDRVQVGDVVRYGSLGYYHSGIARETEDGGLSVNRGGAWYADFVSAERMRPVLGYSGTGGPASGHAANGGTINPDGFAPALCRSNLFVLIDHASDDTQVPATSGAFSGDASGVVGCNRCRALLEGAGL